MEAVAPKTNKQILFLQIDRTPRIADRFVAKPLRTQDSTNTEQRHIHAPNAD